MTSRGELALLVLELALVLAVGACSARERTPAELEQIGRKCKPLREQEAAFVREVLDACPRVTAPEQCDRYEELEAIHEPLFEAAAAECKP